MNPSSTDTAAQRESMAANPDTVTCTVAICVYTDQRLAHIQVAVETTLSQMTEYDSLLLVVDHHPLLAERLREIYSDTACHVIESSELKGLSGARNTAIATSTNDVIVFLDDDAAPRPGWLNAFRQRFTDPTVTIVGGAVEPEWEGERAPRWFPAEYGWVVGCDYRGMPGNGAAIRNPIGANMAVRRSAFALAGTFAHTLGRVGTVPAGCEETDMSIRIAQQHPEGQILRDTSAVVDHAVPLPRQRPRYFIRRCFHEGRSKAALSSRVGASDGLSSERSYVLRTLTTGIARHVGALGKLDVAGVARAFMLGVGLMAAAAGYLTAPRRRTKPTPEPFDPIPVVDIDVAAPLPAPNPNGSGQLWVLARSGRTPVETQLVTDLDGENPSARLREALEDVIGQHHVPTPAPLPSSRLVTVVVCTLGTEPRLRQTVQAILEQTHSSLDVIVVDNDPQQGNARALVDNIIDPRLCLLDEPYRGVSAARNRGTRAARGDIIAFTDDDAIPDPEWIAHIAATFDHDIDEAITCVTGLVTSAEFSAREQLWFEEYGGFDKGFRPMVWSKTDEPETAAFGDIGERDWFFPYSLGVFGSGNNMAFRVARLRELGGFDEALGAGTITKGGEDLDVFRAVIMSGDTLVYTPEAHVRHRHRDTYSTLREQLYGYGTGMAAVLTKELLSGPRRAFALATRIPVGVWRLLAPSSAKNQGRSTSFPPSLVRTELAGYFAGPWRFLRSRRAARRAGRAGIDSVGVDTGRDGTT